MERAQIYLSGLTLFTHLSTSSSPLPNPHCFWAFPAAAVASPGCILPRLQADGGWMAADGAPKRSHTFPLHGSV